MQISAVSIANRVRLARTQVSTTYVLVEGYTDARFYKRFLDPTSADAIPAGGKDTALEAIRILNEDGVSGVLAVLDADFDRLLPTRPQAEPNTFLTDGHDLEVMLIRSRALDKLLAELGSKDKIERIEGSEGRGVREILLEACRCIGVLRMASQVHRHNLSFSPEKYGDFVPDDSPSVDVDVLVKEVINHSQAHSTDKGQLKKQIADLHAKESPLEDLVCGHDLTGVLAIWLRKLIGSCKPKECDIPSIERGLRLAFETGFFRETNLYRSLRDWEVRHEEHPLLAFQD